ncbi:uncharacterized protein NEMAJ01_1254 [Nematocida major]|uniref:uncharacterized protein n=1 Tax=Nematocida major TaxID=1912982 RepID=UPI0020081137|nr:uncharacterized protein NEMAJ01_1254 [Nematocida major]KAH9386358.1 hypothetical protein NEMAJ01_1254 [Nematocida major]
MSEALRKAIDIVNHYLQDKDKGVNDVFKFVIDSFSLYLINAENENVVGFSEKILRDSIIDILTPDTTDNSSEPEVMAQIPVSSIEYDTPMQRKRRGSVTASGNPFAMLVDYPKPESVSLMLQEILANTRLVAGTMDAQQMKRLVSTMYMQNVKKGDRLISQGEYGKTMYLIESGEFQIMQNGRLKATLRKNSLFGEISLLYSCPRTASVVCTIDATVWVVTSDAYTAILMVDQRRNREFISKTLERSKTYMALSPEDKNKVLYQTHLMQFAKGDLIDVSDAGVFLVLSPEIPMSEEALESPKNNEVTHATLEEGWIIQKGAIVCGTCVSVLFVPDYIYPLIRDSSAFRTINQRAF